MTYTSWFSDIGLYLEDYFMYKAVTLAGGIREPLLTCSSSCIFQKSIGLPDVHSGYGFAIGNMAAFDMADPTSVVSPGGVGFDINCGVRLLRTNLSEKDVHPMKEQLAQCLFDHIPVGVGSKGIIPMTAK